MSGGSFFLGPDQPVDDQLRALANVRASGGRVSARDILLTPPAAGAKVGLIRAAKAYFDRLDDIEARFDRVMVRRWNATTDDRVRDALAEGYCRAQLQADLDRVR